MNFDEALQLILNRGSLSGGTNNLDEAFKQYYIDAMRYGTRAANGEDELTILGNADLDSIERAKEYAKLKVQKNLHHNSHPLFQQLRGLGGVSNNTYFSNL